MTRLRPGPFVAAVLLFPFLFPPAGITQPVASWGWEEIVEFAPWSARAGLQVVQKGPDLFLLGGRTPRPPSFPPIPGDSDIWGDVWKSGDGGYSWDQILETDSPGSWPARAYFQVLQKGPFIYVVGGQNFKLIENPGCPPFPSDCPPLLSVSDFFNDTWRSRDGVQWVQMSEDGGWEGRAGLSAVVFKDELFVLGGSKNDDSAIIGGPPQRIYFNDVWKSKKGDEWTQVTSSAPWEARAGAVVVVKDDYMYLIGGENGFVCEPLPFCTPPYFNDVWRTTDGAHWDLVTEAAAWPARPGHQCVVVRDQIVCFGGFGLITNPMDVWISEDGQDWTQVSGSPWNAVSPEEIKYDFDALVYRGTRGDRDHAIMTFGGDRETFDFADPLNYLRVDNDVWRFEPPNGLSGAPSRAAKTALAKPDITSEVQGRLTLDAYPSPFTTETTFSLHVPEDASVSLDVFDVAGRRVYATTALRLSTGRHDLTWSGTDENGRSLGSGLYVARAVSGREAVSRTILLVR